MTTRPRSNSCGQKLENPAWIVKCYSKLVQEVVPNNPIQFCADRRAEHRQKLADSNGVIAYDSTAYRE